MDEIMMDEPLSPLQMALSALLRSNSIDAKNVSIEVDNAKLPLEDYVEASLWESMFQVGGSPKNHSLDASINMDESHLSQRWETSASNLKFENEPSPPMRSPELGKSSRKGGMEMNMKRPERRLSDDSLSGATCSSTTIFQTPPISSFRKVPLPNNRAEQIVLQSPTPQLTLETYPKTPPGTYFGRSLTDHEILISPITPPLGGRSRRGISTAKAIGRPAINETKTSRRRTTGDDRCAPTPPIRRNTSDLQSMSRLLQQLAVSPLDDEEMHSMAGTSTCPSEDDDLEDELSTQSPTTTITSDITMSITSSSIKGNDHHHHSTSKYTSNHPSEGRCPTTILNSSSLRGSLKFPGISPTSPRGKANRRSIKEVIEESIAISKSGRANLLTCPL